VLLQGVFNDVIGADVLLFVYNATFYVAENVAEEC